MITVCVVGVAKNTIRVIKVDYKRLDELFVIILENYPQHQKDLNKGLGCRCEACQALYLLKTPEPFSKRYWWRVCNIKKMEEEARIWN